MYKNNLKEIDKSWFRNLIIFIKAHLMHLERKSYLEDLSEKTVWMLFSTRFKINKGQNEKI